MTRASPWAGNHGCSPAVTEAANRSPDCPALEAFISSDCPGNLLFPCNTLNRHGPTHPVTPPFRP